MIQNLIFETSFLQKNFRAYNFLYSSTRFSGHHQSLLFNFRFFSRESQSQQKLPKKVTHFVKKTSLIIWTSTHLKLKIICYAVAIQPKKFSEFAKDFPANMFLYGTRKKHLHSTVSWRPKLRSWSTLKRNVRLFLYVSVRKDVVRFNW